MRFRGIALLTAAWVALFPAGCSGGSVSPSSAPPAAGGLTPTAPPGPTTGFWAPPLATPWQWQLTGGVDESVSVAMYDIDLFDNSAGVVASLHSRGRRVVCYVSAGTLETWRQDASLFPLSILGSRVSGFGDERWLDVRRLDILGPIMEARMDLCRQKGFDAIEADNVDGYTNRSGFPLTAADQLRYNIWLAAAAHARGLSIGLKNDLDQVGELVSHFDWALNEQCFEYNECDRLAPFTAAGKAVFEVEYNLSTTQFCPKALALRFNSMKKDLNLGVFRDACG